MFDSCCSFNRCPAPHIRCSIICSSHQIAKVAAKVTTHLKNMVKTSSDLLKSVFLVSKLKIITLLLYQQSLILV